MTTERPGLLFLGFATAITAIVTAQLGAEPHDDVWRHMTAVILFVASFAVMLVPVRLVCHAKHDDVLLASVVALSGLGVAALYRIDQLLAFKQLAWLAVGNSVFAAFYLLPIRVYMYQFRRLWPPLCLFLLAATLLFGIEVKGSRAWIEFGIRFQPAEPVKLLLIFCLATYFRFDESLSETERRMNTIKASVLVAVVTLLLVAQRDLGTSLLIFFVSLVLLYVATRQWKYLLVGTATAGTLVVWAYFYFHHVRLRIAAWFNPWQVPDGAGYQTIQTTFALNAGGLVGKGWGQGMPDRIPAVETDLIFALITEELGFLGAAATLILMALMSIRILRPASGHIESDAEKIVRIGVSLLFAVQSGIIVAGTTRLLPLTGITFPFVSYGGSSIVTSFGMLGIVYSTASRPRPAIGRQGRRTGPRRE